MVLAGGYCWRSGLRISLYWIRTPNLSLASPTNLATVMELHESVGYHAEQNARMLQLHPLPMYALSGVFCLGLLGLPDLQLTSCNL